MSKPSRNSADLRDILFATISDVRSGKMEAGSAAQVASLARQINDSARVDIEFARAAKELSGEQINNQIGPQRLTNEPPPPALAELEEED